MLILNTFCFICVSSIFIVQVIFVYIYELWFNSVRTPGGKLVYQYLKKPKKIPRCGQCKDKLRGIQPARPMERSRMCRRKKTVKRAYGGVLCHKCVKER
jgi:ribosomal protein L34E